MKLRLRGPHARFSPCRIQIPPIRTIKTPIRLLITRITALNTRFIVHLECTAKLMRAGIVCGFAILDSRMPPMRIRMKFDGFRMFATNVPSWLTRLEDVPGRAQLGQRPIGSVSLQSALEFCQKSFLLCGLDLIDAIGCITTIQGRRICPRIWTC